MGTATAVAIGDAAAVVVDGNGNTYITDGINNRIRRVTPAGTISTIAGNGIQGYGGDGGPATNAKLNHPVKIALDGSGNLYIADSDNHRIRKVTPGGIISTVAGNGSAGFSGDGGTATAAQLYRPFGIAVDNNGNLFIAEYVNHRIRKVTSDGIISTVAGNGNAGYSGDGAAATSAQLKSPYAVAVDENGNLYIADSGNHCIRKVTSNGLINTLTGNGIAGYNGDGILATTAQLNSPLGVALDGNGNILIADRYNQRIRKVSPDGMISTIAGNGIAGFSGDGGQASNAKLNAPYTVATDISGNLFIADVSNNRIRKVRPDGVINTIAGNGFDQYSGDGGPATNAQLNYPNAVGIDGNGNLYIADTGNDFIRKVTPGGIISSVTYFDLATGIAIDGNNIPIVADYGNHFIGKVSPGGYVAVVAGNRSPGYSGDGGPATNAQLAQPYGVAADGNGNFYIADQANNRIRKVNSAGIINTIAGNGTRGFSGDGGTATAAQLDLPCAVAVDGNGNIYISDRVNQRIRKVTPGGIISTIAGNGIQGYGGDGGLATNAQLNDPYGIAVDGSGNLYIAETGNHRIRKVSPQGIISTIAGNGSIGFSGDGGLSTAAQLYFPSGITVDGSGNLYIVDRNNERIRKVTPPAFVNVSPTNPPAICSASLLNLTAVAANFTPSSFSWSSQPAGISATGATLQITAPTVSVPTVYTITVTASDGVESPTASVILTINPTPVVSLLASDTLNCTQSSVTLTAGGGNTYIFSGPGIMSQSGNQAVVNQAGIYLVTATNVNSCSATQTTTVESNPNAPMITLKAGDWTDPSVWSCGRFPVNTDEVQINHAVNLPDSYEGKALHIQYGTSGQLLFNASSRLRIGLP
ncbi:NHL repeat-containing protein [Spirosoma flavus]